MIYISDSTTVQDILDDLESGGCELKDIVDFLEYLEKDTERLETRYPSNYPRHHLEEAIKKRRAKILVIREALERVD